MAESQPIAESPNPELEKKIGKRPQTIPSFRLLKSPAWLTDERFLSLN
jgi:hypothetical protein